MGRSDTSHSIFESSVDNPVLTRWASPEIMVLELNRPSRLNAVDAALARALLTAFAEERHAVVLLTSSTEGFFCSGGDMKISAAERAMASDLLYELYQVMCVHPAPVIAAFDGPAVGAGAQLAIAADFRFVGHAATVQFPGMRNGIAVGAWGLPSLVGRGRAMEICISMRSVGASEAHEIGLVTEVTDDPLARAIDFAIHCAGLDRAALANTKYVAHLAAGTAAALADERSRNRSWSGTPMEANVNA